MNVSYVECLQYVFNIGDRLYKEAVSKLLTGSTYIRKNNVCHLLFVTTTNDGPLPLRTATCLALASCATDLPGATRLIKTLGSVIDIYLLMDQRHLSELQKG